MKQIQLLKERLMSASDGEFSQTITSPCSSNEIGDMFNAYNLMIHKMGAVIKNTQDVSLNLTSQATQLSQSAEHSNQNLDQQNHEIGMICSSLTQMSVTINDVANNAQSASEQVTQNHQQINKSFNNVSQAATSMDQLISNMNKATQVLQQLDNESQHIGTVLTVITSIAEQTNLLALNAAIEAARAGEQGRGFAVVADEVRALAQRVHTSTEEIATIITSLQSDSKSAMAGIEEGQQKSKQAVEMSGSIDHVFSLILESMRNVEQNSTSISVGTQQQTVVAQEVSQNVTDIEVMSRENMKSAQAIGQSASQLSDVTLALLHVVNLYKLEESNRFVVPENWK